MEMIGMCQSRNGIGKKVHQMYEKMAAGMKKSGMRSYSFSKGKPYVKLSDFVFSEGTLQTGLLLE